MIGDLKRLFTIKTLWILINITCAGILAVQLFHVLTGYLKPTITRTGEKEVPLQDMDFPLVIKVCVNPGLNQAALQELGYKGTWEFFLGQSRFNRSVYGWAGHTKNSGKIKSVKEILEHVGDSKIEKIFSYISVYTRDAGIIDIPLEQLKLNRANYPNNCHSLSLSTSRKLKGKQIQQLFLGVRDLGNHTIRIQFVGSTLDTGRMIREHSKSSTGDPIKLKANRIERTYMVDITQRVFVEEDPSATCRDYPNQEYQSYQECDDQFMRKTLPAELTPIWITDHADSITTHELYENESTSSKHKLNQNKLNIYSMINLYLGLMENLVDGSRVSDCPLPCLISYTQTKFLYEKVVGNSSCIDISFSSKVRVTTTDLLRPTLTNFLSEVCS